MKKTPKNGKLKSIPQIRLRDVAAAAGVSLSTASRVISGAQRVSPSAVNAVQAACEKLGYRPDPIARALRAKSTGIIGMIVPGIGNPFFAELVEAVERALRGPGLELILSDSQGELADEAARIRTLIDRRVDGLIVIPLHHRESRAAIDRAAMSLPLIQVDREVDGINGDYVGVDNMRGIQAILDHLVAEGCRRIAFVSGEATSSAGRSRLEAFEVGVRRSPGVVVVGPLVGAFSVDFGRAAARQLCEGTLPDAVLCGSDIIALGVMGELRSRGVRIPEDVRVTGFDGISLAALFDPPLTTLEQPIKAIAEEAVRLLLLRINGDEEPARRSEITATLQVRDSSLGSAERLAQATTVRA